MRTMLRRAGRPRRRARPVLRTHAIVPLSVSGRLRPHRPTAMLPATIAAPGYWIDDDDIASKRIFSFLLIFFSRRDRRHAAGAGADRTCQLSR